MIIGSHNTMSYKSPKQWWLKPIAFLAKCQGVNWLKQYKIGARWFDLRFKYSDDGTLNFGHNFFKYDASDLDEFLYFMNSKVTESNPIYIRVLYEERSQNLNSKYRAQNTALFTKKCEEIDKKYPNLTFLWGTSVQVGERFYDFKTTIPPQVDYYSSQTSLFKSKNSFLRIIDDWFPWFYARLNTKKKFAENKDKSGYIILDFIHYIL